ncbi:flagellar biosynthetic protein FliO [Marinobacter lutaoensis]|mgnify:CR=1 FL=1|jgi:flagellar protein FliO/FliZ|uniref:flagellar biosynthetic protein FliO n=1 Tax=Marinobacter lutaoensis TaxID=135739 RepID=UPI000C0A426E|nr:flagellar biosynthetic protein FliO [Marinobacter lutaoensis]MBE03295.1 flagellar biosynthetic protein FliO [Marinobacter sp.]MBI44523.1 flagellar biosynthetic protein FliO [Oceanospirillales bacterium]NVD34459.1 flagellar biosynthetic protein FliO [Marinobacter lutaoensis]|tara:strand:+ start:825 stop:1265 length:441 start_codon:yes stop_codon:yes gene_type:complete
MRGRIALALLLAAPPLTAEETAGAASRTAAHAPDTLGTLVSLGLGLVAVIAIIYGCAWLVRRMTGMGGVNNQVIRVVSVMALGARERIALVDVGGQQILLGITPSTVRTLHVFDSPVAAAPEAGSGDFARHLQALMGRSRTPPDKD